MNIKDLHIENKELQTKMFFSTLEGKVVSIQMNKDSELKEHITKVPALLLCIEGAVVYEDENGLIEEMKNGDFVEIPPNIKHFLIAKSFSNQILIK